jgi:hypothetical protein
MTHSVRIMAMCAALLAGACGGTGGSDAGGDPGTFQSDIQGTWLRCEAAGGGSGGTTRVISGLNLTVTKAAYSTANCTGAPTFADTATFTLRIGGTTRTTVGSASVTATQVDLIDQYGTFYDLGFVDTVANPHRIYFGDTTGALDGSSLAKRPTSLLESDFSEKQ